MSGIIRWFVDNPIAANLLMIAMLLGGYFASGTVKKEAFPGSSRNMITVSMVYPGAASSEVEQQVVVRIEEAVSDLPGIFQITSESRQGYGQVNVEVIEGHEVRALLNDLKGRVDSINTFPPSSERAIIRQSVRRPTLMWIALFGDADRRTLKTLAYQIKDEMSLLEGVSEVRIDGLRKDEVSIEVSEYTLRRYNLSFDEIATAVRQSSLNVPAGTIRSKDGDIQIQTRAQAYSEDDFAKIVVRSDSSGAQLLLGDIAVVTDGFSEEYVDFTMNGQDGLNMEVKISDDPLLFEGTANAQAYIENIQQFLPDGVQLKINFEAKSLFDSRFNLLAKNAIGGLILVFIILMLFLRPVLAFWVVGGIATTFAGAIWLLPLFDVSVNMLSMFAFLMVLGIVVDDAIIIGESVYRHQQKGEKGKYSAYSGAYSVLKPVMLAVLSTIIFFLPLIDVPSTVLTFTRSIFFVVLLCLAFSLVESLLILPSHLSHMKPEQPSRFYPFQLLSKVRAWFSGGMDHFSINIYRPALKSVLTNKLSTYLFFTFIFAIAMTIVSTGWINRTFFPNIPSPMVMIHVGFVEGTPFKTTQRVAQHIRDQVDVMSVDKDLLDKNGGKPFIREINRSLNGTRITIFVGFTPSEERTVSSLDVAATLKKLIGPLPEAQSYSLDANFGGSDPDIALNLNLLNNMRGIQQGAVDEILKTLSSYPGVINARSNLDSERTEVELELKPYAETLGITLSDIATQVRQGFYGVELQRIPRAKEDVKVMLRYLAEERQTLDTLDHIRIRTSDGREIPIESVALVKLVPGPSTIRRSDRKRNIELTAEVIKGHDADAIVKEVFDKHLDEWTRKYSGFKLTTDGNLRSQSEFGDNVLVNLAKAIILVLALFAIAFRSIFQPFLVILAVPFGFVGAVLGHLIFGIEFSLFSFLGFLACSGVVVNDNLVLLERINQLVKRGESALDAVLNAGVDRFRPILLTSITTFVGLMPILFERSMQAQFLKPMVVSLSFGVVFSSAITLFLVPCCYYGGTQLKSFVVALFSGRSKVQGAVPRDTIGD